MSAQPAATLACPHPEAVGTRWGDDISEERQAELKVLPEQQSEWAKKPKVERGGGVFRGMRLTGADVYWLARQVRNDTGSESVQVLHLVVSPVW